MPLRRDSYSLGGFSRDDGRLAVRSRDPSPDYAYGLRPGSDLHLRERDGRDRLAPEPPPFLGKWEPGMGGGGYREGLGPAHGPSRPLHRSTSNGAALPGVGGASPERPHHSSGHGHHSSGHGHHGSHRRPPSPPHGGGPSWDGAPEHSKGPLGGPAPPPPRAAGRDQDRDFHHHAAHGHHSSSSTHHHGTSRDGSAAAVRPLAHRASDPTAVRDRAALPSTSTSTARPGSTSSNLVPREASQLGGQAPQGAGGGASTSGADAALPGSGGSAGRAAPAPSFERRSGSAAGTAADAADQEAPQDLKPPSAASTQRPLAAADSVAQPAALALPAAVPLARPGPGLPPPPGVDQTPEPRPLTSSSMGMGSTPAAAGGLVADGFMRAASVNSLRDAAAMAGTAPASIPLPPDATAVVASAAAAAAPALLATPSGALGPWEAALAGSRAGDAGTAEGGADAPTVAAATMQQTPASEDAGPFSAGGALPLPAPAWGAAADGPGSGPAPFSGLFSRTPLAPWSGDGRTAAPPGTGTSTDGGDGPERRGSLSVRRFGFGRGRRPSAAKAQDGGLGADEMDTQVGSPTARAAAAAGESGPFSDGAGHAAAPPAAGAAAQEPVQQQQQDGAQQQQQPTPMEVEPAQPPSGDVDGKPQLLLASAAVASGPSPAPSSTGPAASLPSAGHGPGTLQAAGGGGAAATPMEVDGPASISIWATPAAAASAAEEAPTLLQPPAEEAGVAAAPGPSIADISDRLEVVEAEITDVEKQLAAAAVRACTAAEGVVQLDDELDRIQQRILEDTSSSSAADSSSSSSSGARFAAAGGGGDDDDAEADAEAEAGGGSRCSSGNAPSVSGQAEAAVGAAAPVRATATSRGPSTRSEEAAAAAPAAAPAKSSDGGRGSVAEASSSSSESSSEAEEAEAKAVARPSKVPGFRRPKGAAAAARARAEEAGIAPPGSALRALLLRGRPTEEPLHVPGERHEELTRQANHASSSAARDVVLRLLPDDMAARVRAAIAQAAAGPVAVPGGAAGRLPPPIPFEPVYRRPQDVPQWQANDERHEATKDKALAYMRLRRGLLAAKQAALVGQYSKHMESYKKYIIASKPAVRRTCAQGACVVLTQTKWAPTRAGHAVAAAHAHGSAGAECGWHAAPEALATKERMLWRPLPSAPRLDPPGPTLPHSCRQRGCRPTS